jgi:pimeloyl-ACP methyl ester carboxylesterase
MYKISKAAASLVLAACLVSLAACQTAEKPDNKPRQIDYDLGGYFDSLPRDFPEMRKYHASDGSMLTFSGYRHGRKNPVALIYLHGLEGHAGWGRDLSVKLADRSYDVFALDRRGSGLSKGNTKTITGKPPGFEDLVSDVHSFLKPLKGYYESVYLIGNDWGARLALAYGIAYQGQSDGLVLISPRVTNDAPAAFDASQQTADTGRQREMTTDPLRRQQLDDNFILQSKRMGEFIRRYIKRVDQPIQLFLAGDDDIIDRDKVIKLLERGSQPSLDIQSVTGAEHALPVEAPDRIARDIHHWVHYQELSRNAGKAP